MAIVLGFDVRLLKLILAMLLLVQENVLEAIVGLFDDPVLDSCPIS